MNYTNGLDDAWAAAAMQATNISSLIEPGWIIPLNFQPKFQQFWLNEIEDITWPRGDTKFLFEC